MAEQAAVTIPCRCLVHSPSLRPPVHPTPQSSPSISSRADVFVLAQQQVLEGLLERGVAEGVARRVDRGVDVAQPVADGPHGVGDARLAEGGDQHHDVVRRPRDDERQQDGEDRLGHLEEKREEKRDAEDVFD